MNTRQTKIAALQCELEKRIAALKWETHREFIANIFAGDNPARAYAKSRKAKKVERSHAAAASRLLKSVNIREVVELSRQIEFLRLKITPHRILEEIAAVAFTNLNDLCAWDHEKLILKNSKTLGRHAAAISEVRKSADGSISIKARDKLKALELLAKIGGMIDSSAPSKPADDFSGYSVEQLSESLSQILVALTQKGGQPLRIESHGASPQD